MKSPVCFSVLLLFLSLCVSQAQEVETFVEPESPAAAMNDASSVPLSDIFEDPYWVSYLFTGVDLYLAQSGVALDTGHETFESFFASPEVQGIDLGLFVAWLYEGSPLDVANLTLLFDYWRSKPFHEATDPGGNNPIPEGLMEAPMEVLPDGDDEIPPDWDEWLSWQNFGGWYSDTTEPWVDSEPIGGEPSNIPTEGISSETGNQPTTVVDENTAPPLSLSEMFEDPYWIWYLIFCVDQYMAESNLFLSLDTYESPYTYFAAPEVQAIDLGLFWPWLDVNFMMDSANLAVTFDHWRSRAAYPPTDQAIESLNAGTSTEATSHETAADQTTGGEEAKPAVPCKNGGQIVTLTFDGLTLSGGGLSLTAVSGLPTTKTITGTWAANYFVGSVGGNYITKTFDYSSDRQALKNIGPIPTGSYWFSSCEEASFWAGNGRHGIFSSYAWGDYSWSLHPNEDTEVLGRDGFFIHGGRLWDSRGCIDVRFGDVKLHELMAGVRKATGDCCYVAVTVRYSVPQASQTEMTTTRQVLPLY